MWRGGWTAAILGLALVGSASVPTPPTARSAEAPSPVERTTDAPRSAPAQPRCGDERGTDRPVDPCLELLAR
ncbi:MAG: hypothetical protein RL338_133 [Chloroflexota bacterium]|jgi:hypothetical protein